MSISTVRFDEYFGFTDNEVRKLLEYYNLQDKYDSVKAWYDGYRFGNVDVYCPWDVISYCDELTDDPTVQPQDYWSNTSSNDVVRHFIEKVDHGLAKDEIEALVAGEAVVKEIHEELTYNRLYDSINNIWSVLFMTGYLTYRERLTGKLYSLAIPNTEIRNIFTEQIMEMFKKNVAQDGKILNAFCEALQKGDANAVQQRFSAYLNKTISIRDTFVKKSAKENFYHGIMLGILGYKSGWYVRSNKETGNGYSDIFIKDEESTGIILEIKYAENGKYESACKNALHQINICGYADRLKAEGCSKILKYGIACFKKQCQVVVEIDGD